MRPEEREAIAVSLGSVLGTVAQKARLELWEIANTLPILDRALPSMERTTVRLCERIRPEWRDHDRNGQVKVLLVRSTLGASTRYRMESKCEQLDMLGIPHTFRSVRDYLGHPVLAARDAAEHDIAVVHRLPIRADTSVLLYALSRLNRPIVYDADDLVFAPSLMSSIPPLARGCVSHQAWLLEQCTHVIAATEKLAEQVRTRGKPVRVVRNVLSRELLALSRATREEARVRGDVRLGYLSGSPTHDRDLAAIGPALARVLALHPDVLLVLIGPVDAPPELEPFRGRVIRLQAVPWRDLPSLMADIDINLAPLELENPFCQCKSELKYFEAAAVGIPTVATPTSPFEDAIAQGVNGYLARTADDWVDALDELIRRPDHRREMGQAAQRDAESRYAPETGAEELVLALKEFLPGNPSRWPRPDTV
ncbi:MAG: glycosyltransferase [Armatimonadota bacterium]|nr:MAG: glycosyltransferase [Armatimonadota bacterium]